MAASLSAAIRTAPALALTAVGMTLLYASWRSRWTRQRRRLVVASGWALSAAAIPFWIWSVGAEFGASLGLMMPSATVLLLLAYESRQSSCVAAASSGQHAATSRRNRTSTRAVDAGANLTAARDRGTLTRLLQHVWRFLLVVPIGGFSASLIAVVLSRALPLGAVNDALTAVFLLPIFWGCIAYWMLADPRPARPVIGVLGAALASSVILLS